MLQQMGLTDARVQLRQIVGEDAYRLYREHLRQTLTRGVESRGPGHGRRQWHIDMNRGIL